MFRAMMKLTLFLCLGAIATPAAPVQAAPITEQEAHAIAVDAYVYFYSLLSMDVSRKQFTNVEPGKEFGKGPMNMFISVPNTRRPTSRASSGRILTRFIRSHGST